MINDKSDPGAAAEPRPRDLVKLLDMVLCSFPGKLSKRTRYAILDKFAARMGVEAQGEARPMKLEAIIDNQRAKNDPNIRIFRELRRPWGRDASYIASVSCGFPEVMEEIAYRINSFEPGPVGEEKGAT